MWNHLWPTIIRGRDLLCCVYVLDAIMDIQLRQCTKFGIIYHKKEFNLTCDHLHMRAPCSLHIMSSTQAEDPASEKFTSATKERRFKLSRYCFSDQCHLTFITSLTGLAIDVGGYRFLLSFILGGVYILSKGGGGSNATKVTHVRPVLERILLVRSRSLAKETIPTKPSLLFT